MILIIIAIVVFANLIVGWCKYNYDMTDILVRLGVILQLVILYLVINKLGT